MCTFLVNHKLSKPSLFSEEICGSVCAPLLLQVVPSKKRLRGDSMLLAAAIIRYWIDLAGEMSLGIVAKFHSAS